MVNSNKVSEADSKGRALAVKQYTFAFMALFVGLIIIYGNSFQCSWHLDDNPNIVENRNVHLESLSWNNIKKSFFGFRYDQQNINRPLSYLSFALNHYFGGTDVFGYHLINFTIHYLTAMFLFLLLYNTLKLPLLNDRYGKTTYPIALLSVFFWATHPIQVTAVTYIVQRMASMTGLFYIMAMYLYLKGRTASGTEKQFVFFVLGGMAAIFAIASKENAAMLPFSIFLYDLLLIREPTAESIKTNRKSLLLMLVFILLIAFFFVKPSSILDGYKIRPFTLLERLLTEPRVILFYLSLLIYPTSSRMTLLHDVEISTSFFRPWTTLPAIIIILLLIGLAFWIRRKRPLVAYSILFFFLNHLIEGSIVPLELIFEHRNYIPSMFLFVPLAIVWIEIFEYFSYQKSLQILLALTVIFLLSAQGHTVYLRNEIFSNDLTLWNDNVKKAPNLHRPHHNFGKALLMAGLYEDSLLEMQKALTAKQGARINQKYTTYHNLGIYYLTQNDFDKAIPLFLKSLDFDPNNHKSFLAIATIMFYRNSISSAEKYINIALRLNPYQFESYYIRGLILLKKGDTDAAIQAGEKALALNQDNHAPYFVIAEAYRLKNKLTQSVVYFKRVLAQNPKQISAKLALIELYFLLNNLDALKQSVLNLMSLIDKKRLSETILAYHEKDNYLDYSRIERIVIAIQNSISLPSDELNQLLKLGSPPYNND